MAARSHSDSVMRGGLAVALVAGGLMALPANSSAVSDCSYVSSGVATVYTTGGRGDSADGDSIAGVCVDTNTGIDGGYAEVGQNDNGSDTYVVVDGSDTNPGNAAGYVGLSTGYEPGGTRDPDCNGVDEDTPPDYNSGGCFWIKGAPDAVNHTLQNATVTELLVCGNVEGPDWATSPRDGCSFPPLDFG